MTAASLNLGAIALLSRISPWWRFRLYKRLVKDPYDCSQPDRRVWLRVGPHRYEMELSCADWMERFAIDTGHFFHAEITAALEHFLRPGDCLVDIGANLGFVTLTGARLVGPQGGVFSFEPNPRLAGRLQRTIESNGIGNVALSQTALADRDGQLVLVADQHHGNRYVSADLRAAGDAVPVARADDQLRGKLPDGTRVMVKIDVEGGEMMVLRGMPELLARPGAIFLLEVNDELLRRNGASADEVLAVMRGAGYEAHVPRLSPISGKFRLLPFAKRKATDKDYLFLTPSNNLRGPTS